MATTIERVTKTPGICGGNACIRGHRIPVWVLAGYRPMGLSDADVLDAYPSITAADVQAAWNYADEHPDEIEQATRENDSGEEGLVK